MKLEIIWSDFAEKSLMKSLIITIKKQVQKLQKG